MCVVHQIDRQRTEEFADKLVGMLNNGALSLMTSIGHRTELFDVMNRLAPSTSKQIAEAAGLNERYVREWLGAMTVGGIVECDPSGPYYSLPAEHAACLTRASAADNVAVFAQYIGLLGSVEDRIVECFKNGGGVAYQEYERFHDVMAEDSGQSIVSSLFDSVLPLAPGLMERLEQGINALDIGCGQAKAVLLMAERFPNSRITGIDLCEEPILKARSEAEKQGLTNVKFEIGDLTTFDIDTPQAEYDLITAFDAIHDQARPDRVLAGVHRALKPGGTFLMQDIAGSTHHYHNYDHPIGPLLYTISCMHCMTVSLAQNGMGLGAMWGKESALKMLQEAGFTNIEVKNLDHDFQNNYYVITK